MEELRPEADEGGCSQPGIQSRFLECHRHGGQRVLSVLGPGEDPGRKSPDKAPRLQEAARGCQPPAGDLWPRRGPCLPPGAAGEFAAWPAAPWRARGTAPTGRGLGGKLPPPLAPRQGWDERIAVETWQSAPCLSFPAEGTQMTPTAAGAAAKPLVPARCGAGVLGEVPGRLKPPEAPCPASAQPQHLPPEEEEALRPCHLQPARYHACFCADEVSPRSGLAGWRRLRAAPPPRRLAGRFRRMPSSASCRGVTSQRALRGWTRGFAGHEDVGVGRTGGTVGHGRRAVPRDAENPACVAARGGHTGAGAG